MDQRQTRQRLTDDRAATRDRIAAMTTELAALAAASAGSNLDDEHDPEGSTVAFERQQLAALRDRAEAHLIDVDAALARLAERTYGACVDCGEPIAPARLEALPAAARCVRCAARAASSHFNI